MGPDLDTFDDYFEFVVMNEGGAKIVDHPDDPGGLTKFGVTARTYERAVRDGVIHGPRKATAKCGLRDLTREQAKAIYREMYWGPAGSQSVFKGLDLALFDAAINHGPRAAVKFLQKAINVVIDRTDADHAILEPIAEDGIWGPETRRAYREIRGRVTENLELLREFHLFRFLSWHGLQKAAFTKGWFRRGLRVFQASSSLARGAQLKFDF